MYGAARLIASQTCATLRKKSLKPLPIELHGHHELSEERINPWSVTCSVLLRAWEWVSVWGFFSRRQAAKIPEAQLPARYTKWALESGSSFQRKTSVGPAREAKKI